MPEQEEPIHIQVRSMSIRQVYKCFSLRTWRSASMGKEGCDAIAKNIGKMADALLKEDEEHGKQ